MGCCRDEATYEDADAVLHTALETQKHLEAQDAEIERILAEVRRHDDRAGPHTRTGTNAGLGAVGDVRLAYRPNRDPEPSSRAYSIV